MIKFTRADVENPITLERLLLRVIEELDSRQAKSVKEISTLRTDLTIARTQAQEAVKAVSRVEGAYATVFRTSPSGVPVYDEQNRVWIGGQSVTTTYSGLVPTAPGNATYWLNGLTGAWVRLGYGSCWGNGIAWAQASAVAGTWYAVSDTDISDGQLAAVTHDGSGKLTVTDAGKYLVNWSICIEVSIANKHVEGGIGVTPSGGALGAKDDGQNHIEHVTANAELALSGAAILSLAALDAVQVIVSTPDVGTPNLLVDHMNLTLVRIA